MKVKSVLKTTTYTIELNDHEIDAIIAGLDTVLS